MKLHPIAVYRVIKPVCCVLRSALNLMPFFLSSSKTFVNKCLVFLIDQYFRRWCMLFHVQEGMLCCPQPLFFEKISAGQQQARLLVCAQLQSQSCKCTLLVQGFAGTDIGRWQTHESRHDCMSISITLVIVSFHGLFCSSRVQLRFLW